MKRDRYLNQPLQELALGFGSGAPNVFQDLVRFEKVSFVEQRDALVETFTVHDCYVLAPATTLFPPAVLPKNM